MNVSGYNTTRWEQYDEIGIIHSYLVVQMSVSITSVKTTKSTERPVGPINSERYSEFLEYYYSCADVIKQQGGGSELPAKTKPAPQQTNTITLTVREWCWTRQRWVYHEIEIPKRLPRKKFGFDCYFDGRRWRQWWEGMTAKQFVLERKKYRERIT